MPADTAQFPPESWLGFGLDLSTVTPIDIDTATNHILKSLRFIKLKSGGTQQTFGGVTWTVPDGVDVSSDVSGSETTQISYTNGADAASDLETNASLSGKYLAVSAGASASYAINKTFHSKYQYALFNFRQVLLEVGFESFSEAIDTKVLGWHVKELPPFDHSKPDIVKKYKDFFGAFGSHVVTGATYGSRFQLNVWASNENSSVNSNFEADISAEFNGLTTSGKVDSSIKKSDQYKSFSQSVQKLCSCKGGDTKIGSGISSNPSADNIYKDYEKWVATSQAMPGVMTMQVMSLWELMTAAMDEDLNNRAVDVENAFNWVVENPYKHQTKCTLVINSDWGEIGLLNPSAFIIPDPGSKNPPPKENTTFSTTKVIWGKEHSHDFKREVRIDFIIENDGSPVDIELSHGSDGVIPGAGSCKAIIGDEKPYENNFAQRDNNWNTMWFYMCPVNPNPMPN